MLKKSIIFIAIATLCIFCLSGCKGKKTASTDTSVTTDYKTQAAQEINEKNMQSEMSKLENEIDADK